MKFGVNCAKCENFIPIGEYRTPVLGRTCDVDLGHSHTLCPHCGEACVYSNAEVQHMTETHFQSMDRDTWDRAAPGPQSHSRFVY